MDDIKRTYRDVEQGAKETWRKSDGEEDLGDKVGGVGDQARKDLGNAGDAIRRKVDEETDVDQPR
jgi:hypothetical protein